MPAIFLEGMKMNNNIKIVFFDIDDTLYYKKEKRVPNSIFEQALPQLRKKGIKTAIATGRCVGAFPKKIKELINQGLFDAVVSINGNDNYIYNNGLQVLSQSPLSTDQALQIVEKFQSLNIVYAFVGSSEIAVSDLPLMVQNAIFPIKEDTIIDTEFYRNNKVFQMLGFFPQNQDEQVFASGILQDNLKQVRWDKDAVDILDKRTSKIKGIEDVVQHFGFDMNNTMAFGDGLNDIEMLSTVGLGVAMGNGCNEVKQIAKFTTANIEDDGILKGLQHFNIID